MCIIYQIPNRFDKCYHGISGFMCMIHKISQVWEVLPWYFSIDCTIHQIPIRFDKIKVTMLFQISCVLFNKFPSGLINVTMVFQASCVLSTRSARLLWKRGVAHVSTEQEGHRGPRGYKYVNISKQNREYSVARPFSIDLLFLWSSPLMMKISQEISEKKYNVYKKSNKDNFPKCFTFLCNYLPVFISKQT